MAERPLKNVLSFHPPVGADRGRRDIGDAQIGEDVVDGRAFLAEQLAQLGESQEVAAVGQGSDSEGPPGPGGYESGFCQVSVAKRPVGMPAGRAGVGAHGQDSGRDQAGGTLAGPEI